MDPTVAHLSASRDPITPGRVLLAVAVVSWLVLMAPVLWVGPLALDEHISYWMADSSLPGGVLDRSLNYAAIPPLSIWVQQGFLAVFGKTELVFRLPSMLCTLGAIFVCYAAGRDLRNGTTGGVASVLAVWHPEVLDEVRIARCYGPVLLLGSLVLWTTVRWRSSPGSLGWALAWGLSGGALMWTHYTGGPLVVVSGLVLAGCWLWQGELGIDSLVRLGVAVVLLAVLCFPLASAVWRLVTWSPYLNDVELDASVWSVVGPFWWAGLPAGAVVSWILSRTKTAAASRGAFWLAGGCSLLPLLLFVGLSAGELTSLANPRYRVPYAPSAVCFVALLITSRRTWKAAICGTAVALAVSWALSPAPPWELTRLGSPADGDWRELSLHLAEESRTNEPILVQSGMIEGYLVAAYFENRIFQEYAAARVSRFYLETPHPRYGLPHLWNARTGVAAFYRELLESWRNPGTFWVAAATDTDLSRDSLAGIQSIAESAGFEVVERRVWPNATLLHYRRETR